MKHFDKLLLSCALVLVLDGCKDNASLPVDCRPLKIETRSVVEGRTFVFPEIQWQIYDTHEQKVATCQIPVELLPQISTEELVQICMEYPLLMDAYAFDTPMKGLREVIASFNGLQELLKREDNAKCLFYYLADHRMAKEKLSSLTLAEAGRHCLLYSLAEILLAHDKVMAHLNETLLKDVAKFVYDTWEMKDSDKQYHGLLTVSTSAHLCAKTIFRRYVKTPAKCELLDKFLKAENGFDPVELQKIKSLCKSLTL